MRLQNQLKQVRQQHSLSQSELGKLVNVTRQTIAFIEKSEFAPSVTLALRLAGALEIPINELFWLEEESI
ncbi:MAG: transcriptional regulator [Chloroflexi bacterium]|nr:MAG: transcriptional regulator [Chloroflexota bacterium]